jgi:peptide deformylase
MARLPIMQSGEAVLRGKAKAVPASWFDTPKLRQIVADMAETLDAELDGVAIAAPQVDIPYRIFLVRYDRMKPPLPEGEPPRKADVGVFINPEIIKLSKKSIPMDEGCLSVRHFYGKTRRKTRATVRAYDAFGNQFERGAGGILAQAFQHETDHLEGTLFSDKATDLTEIREEDIAVERKERQERRLAAGQYDI